MSNVNPLGYGAPVVKVYTSQKEIVERVTNFKYKHSEDADEECTITIEDTDVNLPDRKEFREGAKLHVVWGYINGVQSKSETVFIRDIKCDFTDKGVKLQLICYDKFASAKQNTKQKIHKDTDLNKLAASIADGNGLDFDEVKEELEAGDTKGLAEPAFLETDGVTSLAIDNARHQQFINYRQYAVLPQGNKSDRQVLDEVAEREPGGPYVVEGRGEELIVKKRNLNQKPIKTLTYGGGNFELIRFTPETKNRAKKSANVNVESAGWDPINKEFIQVNSNISNVNENYLGDEMDGSPRAYPVSQPDPDDIENQDTDLDDDSITFVDPNTGFTFSDSVLNFNTESGAILKESGYSTAAVDNTATSLNIRVLDYTIHDDTVEDNLNDIKAGGANSKQNSSLKKNPATALVIGDPRVVSGKVITILNVSKKYSGNYYVIEAEHSPLFSQGYLMRLKLTKNALGKTKEKSPDKISTDSLDGIVNKEVGPEVVPETTNEVPEVTPDATEGFDFNYEGGLNQPTIP